MSPRDLGSSSLRDVFGSQVSLAELSGDVSESSRLPPAGYSRFGLQDRPPSHTMHIRSHSIAGGQAPFARRHHNVNYGRLAFKILGVVAAGLLHGRLMQMHLPLVAPDPALWLVQAGIFVFMAIALPRLDAMLGRVDSTSASKDWFPVVRGYGMLLGLIYAAKKLSSEAMLFWALANPCLWYVVDRSLDGMGLALAVTLVGTLVLGIEVRDILSSSHADQMRTLGSVATALFGTAVISGNIGRRLLAQ